MLLPTRLWRNTLTRLGLEISTSQASTHANPKRKGVTAVGRRRPLQLECLEGRALMAVISISGPATVNEGQSATYLVSLSEPSAEVVAVDYGFGDITSEPGDHNGADGVLTFAIGETSAEITITTIVDTDVDDDIYQAVLSNPTSGTLGNASVDTTILDDGYGSGSGSGGGGGGGTGNSPPDAIDDLYETAADTSITGNVLSNDTDPDSDALTAERISNPTNGQLTFNTDGSFTYTPNIGYTGPDSFTYSAWDATEQDYATVTIDVTGEAPAAGPIGHVWVRQVSVNTLSLGSVSGDEDGRYPNGAGVEFSGVFAISYTGDNREPFSVSFTTFDITAKVSDNDYTATSGTVMLSGISGEEVEVCYRTTIDTTVELTETFGVRLSSITAPDVALGDNAETGPGSDPGEAKMYVGNDDHASIEIKLRNGESGVTLEGSNFGKYTVIMRGRVDVPVVVPWEVLNQQTEDNDIMNRSGEITLTTVGSAVTSEEDIWVQYRSDSTVESDEGYDLWLTEILAQGRSVSFINQGMTGTIINDDLFAVDILDLTRVEGSAQGLSDFSLTVRLVNPVEGGVDVAVSTEDYTADGVDDFQSKQETISFTEAELEKTFIVNVFPDAKREADEKLKVRIDSYSSPLLFDPTPLPTGTRYTAGNPWALVQITNDDEGIYASGGGRAAFYHGADGGNAAGTIANGTNFEKAALYYYSGAEDVRFNVNSWADAVAALEAYVAVHGRVTDIAFFDHGAAGNQQLGNGFIGTLDFEAMAHLLDNGALVTFFGCDIGAGNVGLDYCDWAADDIGAGAAVRAADGHVFYKADGSTYLAPGSSWLSFDGVDGGYHP